ncbi:hypothetical protein MPSEU_000822200 [Mayamaea pseudoterrestris]|nr:hypothetical protein MPSEU_000822200 [Mayamaea pseudoterrestris]
MPRVFALMEHLISKNVIANQVGVSTSHATINSDGNSTISTSLHDTIIHTITTLLLLIPEASIHASITLSLTRLLLDATTVVSVYVSSSAPDTIGTVQLNVSLIPTATDAASNHATTRTPVSLSIGSLEQARAWQAASFHLMNHYLRRLALVRAGSLHDVGHLVSSDEHKCFVEPLLTPSNVNTCLRIIEWTTTNCHFASADKKGRVLVTQGKLWALQLLSRIFEYKQQLLSIHSNLRLSCQVAAVVAKATHEYLKEQSTPEERCSSEENEMSKLLEQLLIKNILLMPNKIRDKSCIVDAQSPRMIRLAVWPVVLQALSSSSWCCSTHRHPSSSAKSSPPFQVDDQGRLLATSDGESVQLVGTCLAVLHKGVLLEPALKGRLFAGDQLVFPSLPSPSAQYTSGGTKIFFNKLVCWLKDPILGHGAWRIITAWLEQGHLIAIETRVQAVLATSRGNSTWNNGDAKTEATSSNRKRDPVNGNSSVKRQKLEMLSASEDGSLVDFSFGDCLEDQISTFLTATARPAAIRLCAETTGTLSSDCISDAMAVSSAIRLLVSHVDLGGRDNDPCGLAALLSLLLESMVAFCNLLKSCTSTCSACVSVCVDCGAYIGSLAIMHPLLDIFVKQVRHLCLKAAWKDSLDGAPALMHCPLSLEAVRALSVSHGTAEASIALFPGFSLVIAWNHMSATLIHLLKAEFLLGSISGSIELQMERLSFMEIGTGSVETVGDEASLPLVQRRTMVWVTQSMAHSHDNPSIRLLWWQSLAWLLLCTDPRDICRECPSLNVRRELLRGILSIALADTNSTIRDFASCEIGGLMLFAKGCVLSTLLLEHDEVESDVAHSAGVWNSRPPAGQKAEALLQQIDHLLHEHASVPQVLLSSTMRSSSVKSRQKGPMRRPREILECQRAATRSLAALCTVGQLSSNESMLLVFENVSKRLFSLSSGDGSPVPLQMRGLCLAALEWARNRVELPKLLQPYLKTFMPEILYNLLVPSSGFEVEPSRRSIAIESIPVTRRLQNYHLLSTLIEWFVMPTISNSRIASFTSLSYLLKFFDVMLPSLMSQFVIEKEYDALRLTTEFKIFIMHLSRHDDKACARSEIYNIQSKTDLSADRISGTLSDRKATKRVWGSNLEDETRRLSLAHYITEPILATVFVRGGQAELLFFMKMVLQDTLQLPVIMKERETVVFKNLVWQLGLPQWSDRAAEAIRVAALAQKHDALELKFPLLAVAKLTTTNDDKVVSDTMSRHFMYLMVNIVQHDWASKSTIERLQSLNCLSVMLTYLPHSDSSQYIPQIMSTVNAAITDAEGRPGAPRLILRSLEILSQFVRLIARHHWETLDQNLATIVVSLIPILSRNELDRLHDETSHIDDARDAALALLEWLTQGELGKKLAARFIEVPFLPISEKLNGVRTNLRMAGLDFDCLQTSAEEGIQNVHHRNSLTSDGSTSVDRLLDMTNKQEALRRRLTIVRPLLQSENLSIRKVSLQHVSALLRANRELFRLLIDNEGTASMGRYLTVAYDERGRSRGVVVDLIDTLRFRCTDETDLNARLLLAVCLGEVGAVDPSRLDETKTKAARSMSGAAPATSKRALPPWRSSAAQYELILVTCDLVVGLKAATTSTDQNKIAYTIQQLLVLLDSYYTEHDNPANSEKLAAKGLEKKSMSKVLTSKLAQAGVLDVVDPFWYTEYCETSDKIVGRKPPFFKTSKSYSGWMANWCRYMIVCAKRGKRTPWIELFSACKIVMRSDAGLNVGETLLPLLVLERLCFGKSQDERDIINELTSALNFDVGVEMDASERQKAVNTVFKLIATLEHWYNDETERKHRSRGRNMTKAAEALSDDWPRDSTLIRMEDLFKALPLSLRAQAAARVGMHAGALRLLEIAARKTCSSVIFDSSQNKDQAMAINKRSRAAGVSNSQDLNLMKDVLAELYDYDTMATLVDDYSCLDPELRLYDSIKLKEAANDWEGALLDYEHAQHIHGPDQKLQAGSLRCLLELGHYESVLNQARGLACLSNNGVSTTSVLPTNDTLPLAIEASWRLGRWETLAELVTQESTKVRRRPELDFQTSLGSIMLGLKRQNPDHVHAELVRARTAIMVGLSSVARESYSRAYNHIVDLHYLREIEDSLDLLCSEVPVDLEVHSREWEWKGRLDVVSSKGASKVIKTRLALSRLADDRAMEGLLFLNLGTRARKVSRQSIAASSFAQAERALVSMSTAAQQFTLQLEMAKLKYDCGESGGALRLFHLDDEEKLANGSLQTLQRAAVRFTTSLLKGSEGHSLTDAEMIKMYSQSLLQTTQWMVDGGLKDTVQIKDRFMILHRLSPKWEEGQFHYAKYVDSMLETRLEAIRLRFPHKFFGLDEETARRLCLGDDKASHRHILVAIHFYVEALKLDTQHVYQALPRLLSLWFDFTALSTSDDGQSDSKTLLMAQEEMNAFIAREYKMIPPRAFYTAIPQLVSQVTHDCKDTEKLVRVVLCRILSKHPEQAMWHLGWLRQSQLEDRKKIGEEIFQQAEQSLMKIGGALNIHRHKVLVESKSLFMYFHNLATSKTVDTSTQKTTIKPWKGTVLLTDFIPPVQAALSVSFSTSASGAYHESFPRQVPRMRAVCPDVTIMGSKARPKKLKIYVISADTYRLPAQVTDKASRQSIDIGEIHFLVKQEVRGDLRKDARVQDFCNVINRLVTTSTLDKGASVNSRRLRLRTYAVTCLSEDTGILEWVPETAPLRSLISASYNPQASPFSAKRRGLRAATFGDPMLKSNYEKKCQAMFFEHGDLRRAATLFEELCLKPFPPLLYWWFVQHFPDPHSWYEARTRFTMSAAIWSGVGHVIGLGDRHSENILVDMTLGEVVHVDFDCIFDKGLSLPKPEAVPFRLTQNMVDAFGPTGVDGVYTCSLLETMRVLRHNRDTLLSVLEPFVKDPIIDWKRLRSQQRGHEKQGAEKSDPRLAQEAKRSLLVIEQRLRGIYNLRNPNLTKIRRSDLRGAALNEDDDLTHLVPLSVDGQVHKMIAEATSSENLIQLYIGWMPWL